MAFTRWHALVVLIGLAACGVAGSMAAPAIGLPNAFVWTFWLAYTFFLSLGANRLSLWLARPPITMARAPFVGAVAFIPMFLGFFPTTSWTSSLGPTVGWDNIPSPYWIMGLMMLGLIAPGGTIVDGFKRLISLASSKKAS